MKPIVISTMIAIGALAGCASPKFQVQLPVACEAEVLDVKYEVWRQELRTHMSAPIVWQGVAKISLRFLKPESLAGQVKRLGVLEAHELTIGGRTIAPSDRLQFLASEGVLSGSVVPDVLSNLRDVGFVGGKRPNKAPEPTPGLVTSCADRCFKSMISRRAQLAPSPGVAHL